MSHQPLTDGYGEATDESDPLRPYRVHELLTRHAQGKRRASGAEAEPEASTEIFPDLPEEAR